MTTAKHPHETAHEKAAHDKAAHEKAAHDKAAHDKAARDKAVHDKSVHEEATAPPPPEPEAHVTKYTTAITVNGKWTQYDHPDKAHQKDAVTAFYRLMADVSATGDHDSLIHNSASAQGKVLNVVATAAADGREYGRLVVHLEGLTTPELAAFEAALKEATKPFAGSRTAG